METDLNITVAGMLKEIERSIADLTPVGPTSLYDPVRDMVAAGGKRVRPVLTGLSARLGIDSAEWLPAAVAVELLHTFTLAHDDIMDNAPTRRGKPTLHVAYGPSAAILSGDVLIALAVESLSRSNSPHLAAMLREFALAFRLVCEGQALDKDFETRDDLSVADYLHMIDLKTSKVLELAAVLGGYAGGGCYVEELRRFAHHTGLAFQILDDLLDLTASEAAFGKTIGGDVLEGKRTYLFVAAMERYASLSAEDAALLDKVRLRSAQQADIPRVRELFEWTGVIEMASTAARDQTALAKDALNALPGTAARADLEAFSEMLLGRTI